MEEKKQIKISLKVFIIISVVTIIAGIVFISAGAIIYLKINNKINKSMGIKEPVIKTIDKERYRNKDYYIIKGDYSGKYDLQFITLSQSNRARTFEKKEVMNYRKYESYCNEWGLNKVYSDTSKNYIVFSYVAYGSPNLEARLAAVDYSGNIVDLYIWDDASGVTADISAYCIVIPTEKDINNINVVGVYTNTEFNDIKKYDFNFDFDSQVQNWDKPIIYIYPTEETEVTVKLLNDEKITCSYPKYADEWNVLAKPNGDLIDLNTGRKLYALYYESEIIEKFNVSQEGFVVKGEDSAKFLEEKLKVLGLTERETEEFIIYWLPKLESNKYNYIRFATDEEINNNMPLEIRQKPDTIIRVLMIFKGLENPIEVIEQKLDTPERIGFTVVEWGGTEIK